VLSLFNSFPRREIPAFEEKEVHRTLVPVHQEPSIIKFPDEIKLQPTRQKTEWERISFVELYVTQNEKAADKPGLFNIN
jgi:hypothetical protein